MKSSALSRSAFRPLLQRSAKVGRSRQLSVKTNAFVLPQQYGYVIATVGLTAAIVQWQAIKVSMARRESGVKYPKMYADGDDTKAMVFNCTQRAHLNTLESLPGFLAMVTLLGLAYPLVATGLGLTWALGRIVYTLGYCKGDPAARMPGGAISGLSYFGLIGATLYTGIRIGFLI